MLPLCLVFTAGEETFCQGARHLAGVTGALPKAGAMVVCEPTSNRPLVGHRGAIHLEVQTKGISAHASMPELGENAIYKAAEAALKLRELDFGLPAHPLLGKPTLNVGTISGGVNINSIPDQATMGVDIRIIP
ncbi:MAG: peptidase dimerization domain-containing protein, partial [Deltaproteobacteria bacterium]|nr:peptidase dimerization domain-containing protein [Deltaproteobacteria bacterium]